MKSGGTMTFVQLLSEVQAIEIPVIQRDYAQGRRSVAEVREQFLAAIFDTLSTTPEELLKPLDLDFIYGSLNGGSGDKFWPLDGQQRLTTLYLLHWYLACQDGEFGAFQDLVLADGEPRFTYETRRSSAEFFKALASHDVNLNELFLPPAKPSALSESIKDRQWFFLSWNLDPTIQAALSMLDAIDARFRGEMGLYCRITDTTTPYITFQFLNLEEFGLSDDLYIKMNARGKPLTPFENFKAKFEQFVGQVCQDDTMQLHGMTMSLKDYLGRKIDTDWSDLFWHFCGADTNQFDDQAMQFFRSMIVVFFPLGKSKEDRSEVVETIRSIRDSNFKPSFYQYQKRECFDRDFVIKLLLFMDTICSKEENFTVFLEDAAYYDEEATFRLALEELDTRGKNPKGLTYERAIQFFAWCIYLIRYPDNISSARLFDWMRVIHNLSENTRVERPREFTDALYSVMDLIEPADSIISYLANPEEDQKIVFFYSPQVREERIKAQLIERSPEWRGAIFRAEQHGYFKGQIEFLFDFSGVLGYFVDAEQCDWDDQQDQDFLESFTSYLDISEAVFNRSGLRKFSNNLFERALLTKGDYLLYGRSNHSFLDNDDRDTSWKRLLRGSDRVNDDKKISEKRKLVGTLLSTLDLNDVEGSLSRTIEEAGDTSDWRMPFIWQPELIAYCEKRYIRKISDDSIYLMKRIQMNGAHLELWTHSLYLDYFTNKRDVFPFRGAYKFESYGYDEEPGIRLVGMLYQDVQVHLEIIYRSGKYQITLDESSLMTELDGFMGAQADYFDRPVISLEKNAFRDSFPALLARLCELASNEPEDQ